MATAVIVDAVRTAGGKRYGKLSGWHAADLAAETLKALAERNNLDPALVEDVIMGCVMQVGDQSVNVGRSAVLAAGWPESVPATTIDRQCGSSQQSAHFAAQGVMAGAYDIVVAAGVEVMSKTPMGASVTPGSFPMGPKVMERYAPRGGVVMQGTSRRSSPPSGASPAKTSTRSPCRATSGPPPPPPRAASTTRSSPSPRSARPRDRPDHRDRRDGHRRRGHPPRLVARDARQAEAGLPGGRWSPPPTRRRSPTARRPC
jgi:hypothetical protein